MAIGLKYQINSKNSCNICPVPLMDDYVDAFIKAVFP